MLKSLANLIPNQLVDQYCCEFSRVGRAQSSEWNPSQHQHYQFVSQNRMRKRETETERHKDRERTGKIREMSRVIEV